MIKTYLRDLLPAKFQVPAKYWYGFLRGTLDTELQLLSALVNSGDRVLDVGGNRGVYAYHLHRLGASVQIFEPNPICCRVLAAWSRGLAQISLHTVALSDREGTASLFVPISDGVAHDASASLENQNFSQSQQTSVELRRLDTFMLEDISFIKVDVEGHESTMLAGARETLIRCKPTLLIEIEQRHNQQPISAIFNDLLSLGYSGYFVEHGRLRRLELFNTETHQNISSFGQNGALYIYNFLFLHDDASEMKARVRGLLGSRLG